MTNSLSNSNMSRIIRRCIAAIIFGMILVLGFVIILSKNLPSLEQLENYNPDLVTRIYSADGKVLNELFVQKRVFVELDKIPTHMQNAVVASEDRRFYDHWGLSLRSVARAIVINTLSMSYRQGFSTLTQQLARNLYKKTGKEAQSFRDFLDLAESSCEILGDKELARNFYKKAEEKADDDEKYDLASSMSDYLGDSEDDE